MNWITPKSWEARSQLYRRRSLQVNLVFSICRGLQDLHSFAPLQSERFSKFMPTCRQIVW